MSLEGRNISGSYISETVHLLMTGDASVKTKG